MAKSRTSLSKRKRETPTEVPRAPVNKSGGRAMQRRKRGDDASGQNTIQPAAVSLRDYIPPPETPATTSESTNGNQNQDNPHALTNSATSDEDTGFDFRIGVHCHVHPADGIPSLADDPQQERRITVIFRGSADLFTPANFLLAVNTILQQGLGEQFSLPLGIVLRPDMVLVVSLCRPDDGDIVVVVNVG